jgi:NTE family protein
MENSLGLVLTGGGARGAYQAGVLKRIGEIPRIRTHKSPFPIIAGSSAGAINGALLAAGIDEFSSTTDRLAGIWSRLKPSDVFRCDLMSQAHNSITWMLDLLLGGLIGGGNARSVLDATPLMRFLGSHLRCDRLQVNIRKGHLYALAISATSYKSGKSYLFIQGQKGHPVWSRSRRVAVATKISVEHVCASAAIPIIFQPVRLKIGRTTGLFGDGCVRLQQPLSPAIRLGANRILAIGVNGENLKRREESVDARDPSVGQIMGVLFGVIFLDNLVTDNEHLERLNKLLHEGHLSTSGISADHHIRPLTSLLITPSVDLSEVAEQYQRDMPYQIQYFVNSLGRNAACTSELMSYLLFTEKYTSALVDLGYHDAGKRIAEIEGLLYPPAGQLATGLMVDRPSPDEAEDKSVEVHKRRSIRTAAAAARKMIAAVWAAIRAARARLPRKPPPAQ